MSNQHSLIPNLQFLKLGGSLITDKFRPHTARLDVIQRLAAEIAGAKQERSDLALVLGHGSGSFGHVAGQKYGTRQGVSTPEAWVGFVEVWRAAQDLNRLVVDAFLDAGLRVVAFSPLAAIIANDGKVQEWHIDPLRKALQAGLIPIVYGDVAFDISRKATILSTEDLFAYLAPELHPTRILLAGIEPGVWADYPTCTQLLGEIRISSAYSLELAVSGSNAPDVTGGMASKLSLSLELAQANPGLQVHIFSGEAAGSVRRALTGEALGTRIFGG
jgi:isopentenyl phosphate kinase